MSEHKKKKQFIELPRFIGDKKSFKEFVRINMKYPAEALEQGIEGVVYLLYMVNDQGKVTQVEVEKGLGHGCDEEATRLVKLMRFSKAKNRGFHVSSRNKARIEFKLPPRKLTYELKKKAADTPAPEQPAKGSYSYTLRITPSNKNKTE